MFLRKYVDVEILTNNIFCFLKNFHKVQTM